MHDVEETVRRPMTWRRFRRRYGVVVMACAIALAAGLLIGRMA